MEESELSAAPPITQNHSWGINSVAITQFSRSRLRNYKRMPKPLGFCTTKAPKQRATKGKQGKTLKNIQIANWRLTAYESKRPSFCSPRPLTKETAPDCRNKAFHSKNWQIKIDRHLGHFSSHFSGRKRGVEFRGVAFMTVLAVLTVLAALESTLPSFCLSYKIQHNEATVAVLTVLAVLAVMAVSVMTAPPLKLQPPFP